MKIAYFNCSSGIAGDMILAACIDAGVSARGLESRLRGALKLSGWRLKVAADTRLHYPAKRVSVEGTQIFSSPREMQSIIRRSSLSPAVIKRSLDIVSFLVAAEALVHGVPPAQAHFHELNSIDTLVDICGACLCMELLGIDEVLASPVNVGNPAPATIAMTKAGTVPVFSSTALHELATPTGMAVVARLARRFGPLPAVTISASGIGAGARAVPGTDNVLKVLIGDASGGAASAESDTVVLLETNIDDMDPRVYPYVMEKLLSAGARDAWLTQVLMKKGRPGIVVSVLCDASCEPAMLNILFAETTTLGVRRSVRERTVLRRRQDAAAKTGFLPGGGRKTAVEFEPARARARATGAPLRRLLRAEKY